MPVGTGAAAASRSARTTSPGTPYPPTAPSRAAKTVATLTRDFEQTIAYYALEGVARQLVRTTSLLERANREIAERLDAAIGTIRSVLDAGEAS